jgi:tetratricopeptide (TPR) repeat protein
MQRTVIALVALVGLLGASPAPSLAARVHQLIVKAEKLYRNGDRPGAMVAIEQALRLDPRDVIALADRGDMRDNAGDHAGALADYDAALAIAPTYEYGYRSKCATQFAIGRYADAIATCTKAISLEDASTPRADRSEAYRMRGEAKYYAGDSKGTVADTTAAITLEPTNTRALAVRCNANVDLGAYAAAGPDCDKAIAIGPAFTWTFYVRGTLYNALQRWSDAQTDLQTYLKANPKDEFGSLALAQAENGLGENDLALADVNAFLAVHPDATTGLDLRTRIQASLAASPAPSPSPTPNGARGH